MTILVFTTFGCTALSVKQKGSVPIFLSPLATTEKDKLVAEVNRIAEVKTIRGKVDFKFEDNSFAASGLVDKYKAADGTVVVQSPASINLKIQVPFVGSDLVEMTSNGDKFRVAVICCVNEKYKRFVYGTNTSEYNDLRERAKKNMGNGNAEQQAISVFASLRPQHFTDALLLRPIQTGGDYVYTQSEIYEDEEDVTRRKTRISRVIRGYYLLDELHRDADGDFKISRRFWFDRTNNSRFARQQIFSSNGVLETDIVYGAEQKVGDEGQFSLPAQVQITRPQERYSVRLTYQNPQAVVIGKNYDSDVFQLENKWQLPEVDLDKQPAAR